jgi:SIR2-like domain
MTERESRPLVLVLGAGASLGARSRCVTVPPLGCGLGGYLLTWLDANDPRDPSRLAPKIHERANHCPRDAGNGLWREPLLPKLREGLKEVIVRENSAVPGSRAPFEVLMDGWIGRQDGRDLLITMQKLLAHALLVGRECAFDEHPDLLDRLVRGLPRDRPLIVVTLNYDILIEDALGRAERRYTYPSVEGVDRTIFVSKVQGEPIPMYKIHGSINWLSLESGVVSSDLQVVRQSAKSAEYIDQGQFRVVQTYATYVPPHRRALLFELERSTKTPVAAVYGTGKPVVANPRHVDAHRQDCCAEIAKLVEADALVVGLRPVGEDDDPVLHEVLRTIAKLEGEKTYVNPSDDDCRHFERLGYGTVAKTLEDWLDAWPHRQAPDTQ